MAAYGGFVQIISIDQLDPPDFVTKRQFDEDAKKVGAEFKRLGFHVDVQQNPTYEGVKQCLTTFTNDNRIRTYQPVILFILCYGYVMMGKSFFYSQDSQQIFHDDVIDQFKCQHLRSNFKLIVFNTTELLGKKQPEVHFQTDAAPLSNPYFSNLFLIATATFPNSTSIKGSPFVNKLSGELKKYSDTPDFWDLLVKMYNEIEWDKAFTNQTKLYELTNGCKNIIKQVKPQCCKREDNIDLNGFWDAETTKLQFAVMYGHLRCCRHLLQMGICVDATDKNGNTALHYAAITNRDCQLLLENGAYPDPQNYSNSTPLHDAASSQNIESIYKLLFGSAYVNAKNSKGYTSLHNAACVGSTDICRILLSNKTDINAVCDNGNTPLHLTALYGNKECCELLLKHGADHTMVDKNNRTPRMIAEEKNHEEIAALLGSLK